MERNRDLVLWVWLSEALGAGSRMLPMLLDLYGHPFEIYNLTEDERACIKGLSPRALAALANKSTAHAEQIIAKCCARDIEIVCYEDEHYPSLLRFIEDPPTVLYCKGDVGCLNERICVGAVGKRDMSEYGMHAAYRISHEVASSGAVVVSGLARGIDAVCSTAAIDAGGFTVAVLGSGIDVIYPKQNAPLYGEICRTGAVISEFPPDTAARDFRFPMRNRIISALSHALLVIEAGEGSGALITAKAAVKQGRRVFALPADVGREGALGVNELIGEGARPLLKVASVLEECRADAYAEGRLLPKEVLQPSCELPIDRLTELGILKRTRKTENESFAKDWREEHAQNKNMTEKRVRREEPATVVPTEPALDAMEPIQRDILRALSSTSAVTTDALSALPYSYAELTAALTILEIEGYVRRLPGSTYIKA